MTVRAKFRCVAKTEQSWGPGHNYPPIIKLQAVGADEVPENQRYHRYTPSGELTITIDNPPAAEFFKLGEVYYLDFTPAEG